MSLTAQDVITRANDIIQDQTNVRWPQAELLRWLNDGRRELCVHRPDVYATTVVTTLAAGTRQAIPADGTRFLDAVRNMAANGTDPGRAVRIIEREILDAQNPEWHLATPVASIQHFMFDERVPKTFYVFPPSQAGVRLEIAYAQVPVEITNPVTVLTAEDMYVGAIVDYVCYRAFSKDIQYAGNVDRAAAHYLQFKNLVVEGDARDERASPNTARLDGRPPRST